MIYDAVILWERPLPTLGGAQWLYRFRRIQEPPSSIRGEYGCAYSKEKTPSTCANFLTCNRQIYAEMMEAIRRAVRKGLMAVKLDCIAEDESFHYFTWLSIPLVRTSWAIQEGRSKLIPGWADKIMGKYLTCPHRVLSTGHLACRAPTTSIHQLWIDIRLVGDRSAKWVRNSSSPDRTSWAVCAALRRLFEKGQDFSHVNKETDIIIRVGELVLNVVTPPDYPSSKYLDEDFPRDGVKPGLVHPATVARELVDVWSRIWRADEYKGGFYQILLERIERVRVCINGEMYRIRELRLELERGQAERRRIAARTGWW